MIQSKANMEKAVHSIIIQCSRIGIEAPKKESTPEKIIYKERKIPTETKPQPVQQAPAKSNTTVPASIPDPNKGNPALITKPAEVKPAPPKDPVSMGTGGFNLPTQTAPKPTVTAPVQNPPTPTNLPSTNTGGINFGLLGPQPTSNPNPLGPKTPPTVTQPQLVTGAASGNPLNPQP